MELVDDQQDMEDYNEALLDPKNGLDLSSAVALLPKDAETAEQPIRIRQGGVEDGLNDGAVCDLRRRGH